MGRIKDLILSRPEDPLVQPYFAYLDQLEFQLLIEPSEYFESVPITETVFDYDEDVPF
jgi:hypothetical protein